VPLRRRRALAFADSQVELHDWPVSTHSSPPTIRPVFTEGPSTEETRRQFLPEDVRILLIGESAPANGTFFYKANSKLYDATKEAFRLAVPKLVRGPNFLDRFMALGCYLDDLCLTPVNHWRQDNPLAWQRRLQARVDGE
jgi:hypothetical protein